MLPRLEAWRIALEWRDIDVPLSELGKTQSAALGDWFGALAQDEQPQVILCSPYLRAKQTAALVAQGVHPGGHASKLPIDERLREKEFGILDRLTKLGIQQQHPELDEQRRHVGKSISVRPAVKAGAT